MRDVILMSLVLVLAAMALRRPWIGVMLWTWLSIMNPHRFTWGWAHDAPLAAIAAGSTLVGLLLTRERNSPFKGGAVAVFVLFTGWVTLSWSLGLDPARDYPQWDKVMKINLMVVVALALLHSRLHIMVLVWVCALSLALLGVKGGLYTIATGGDGRVWGPPGSFIADNNEFGLAMVMTIPLLRFLQMQVESMWVRHGLTGAMLLCAAAALGTQSRGALLAIVAMTVVLWWRGRSRWLGGAVMVAAAVALVSFMPEQWTARMESIDDFREDGSAMGRISAWHTAWGVAMNYPFGAGFNVARPELFAAYSPYYGGTVHAAHSIYFQVLGNHGFVGLALFLALWVITWRNATWLRKSTGGRSETRWCADLGAMCQVSLVGYAVGGAFLSLSYFDLPYNIMAAVVLTRVWVMSRAWEREPAYGPRWGLLLGPATRVAKG